MREGDTIASAILKPAPDRIAHHEDGRPLAAEGEEVTLDPWWMRRLIDQDVEIVGAPPPVAAATIAPAPRSRRGKPA